MNKEQEPGYYRINNTKHILYWDGEKWLKPEKDSAGRYYIWASALEKQPEVKSIEPAEIQNH